MTRKVAGAPPAERTIVVLQRDGSEVELTLREARLFAFRLLTAVAQEEGKQSFADLINAKAAG